MQKCKHCGGNQPETSFSWNERSHKYRDRICKPCRASLKRQRYIPKHTVRQHSFANKHGTLFSDALYAHLTDLECAYIAGLIDGEGCITSSQPKNNSCPLIVKISMVHRPTIEWLDEKLGGGLTRHKTKQVPARTSWFIALKGARSVFLLRRLLPYMKTKAQEADVALRLGDSLFAPLVRGKVTPEVRALRAELGQKLRDLKRLEWKEN